MHLTSSGSKQAVWAFPSDRRKKERRKQKGKKKPCIAGQSRYQLLSQVKPAVFTYFWCRRVTRTVLGTNFLRTSQSRACFPVNRSNDDHIHGSINHRCPSKTIPTYLSAPRSSCFAVRSFGQRWRGEEQTPCLEVSGRNYK